MESVDSTYFQAFAISKYLKLDNVGITILQSPRCYLINIIIQWFLKYDIKNIKYVGCIKFVSATAPSFNYMVFSKTINQWFNIFKLFKKTKYQSIFTLSDTCNFKKIL